MFSHTDRHSLFCSMYCNVFCYQIFHLERQDGCGRSYENVIQTFVRTTAICVLPVILCSAMSYFMVRVRFPSLIRQIVVSCKLFDFNHHFVPTICFSSANRKLVNLSHKTNNQEKSIQFSPALPSYSLLLFVAYHILLFVVIL